MEGSRGDALSDLRRRVLALEGAARARRPALAFGVDALDRHLPWGGLPRGALHEFGEGGLAAEHAAAATLFAAGVLARTRGMVLWCLSRRDLFAPALAAVGLGPDRVIYVEAGKDVLPAMEEGLRHGGLAGVVGETARLGLVASRRLQLAAEGSGTPAFALRRARDDGERESGAEPNAAATRWRIAAAPSLPPAAAAGLGRARWRVDLLRCRGAAPASWLLESCDAEGRLAPPAVLPDRPDPAERRQGPGRPAEGGRRRARAVA